MWCKWYGKRCIFRRTTSFRFHFNSQSICAGNSFRLRFLRLQKFHSGIRLHRLRSLANVTFFISSERRNHQMKNAFGCSTTITTMMSTMATTVESNGVEGYHYRCNGCRIRVIAQSCYDELQLHFHSTMNTNTDERMLYGRICICSSKNQQNVHKQCTLHFPHMTKGTREKCSNQINNWVCIIVHVIVCENALTLHTMDPTYNQHSLHTTNANFSLILIPFSFSLLFSFHSIPLW